MTDLHRRRNAKMGAREEWVKYGTKGRSTGSALLGLGSEGEGLPPSMHFKVGPKLMGGQELRHRGCSARPSQTLGKPACGLRTLPFGLWEKGAEQGDEKLLRECHGTALGTPARRPWPDRCAAPCWLFVAAAHNATRKSWTGAVRELHTPKDTQVVASQQR